ncbi:MAG: SRPBCC domain-containing protein [Acidobacteria bacterium]|nr:SRPBCC domain-containing protein [Acidobacteriota bacterium]
MTKRLHFSTVVEAPRQVVWDTMLGSETYRAWTAPFGEGSYFEGAWDQGHEIRFLGPGGSGGMLAVIAENRPHEFVSIKHVGVIKDGVVDTGSSEVQAWAPAFENYTLSDAGGSTKVDVELDSVAEWNDFMSETWPKALSKLKALAEARSDQTK